jgi:hypothetical protein
VIGPAVYRYGPDQAQFGELTRPDRAVPLGTVVIIHGGFWRARYDLSLGRPLAADLAARGYLHSRGDQRVPFSYSERYVAASAAAGGHATLVETFGDHFTLIDPAGEDWETAVVAVRESLTLKI